jgi:serine/threonine-protein kinase RsbW
MTIQSDNVAVRTGLGRLLSMAPLLHLSDDVRGNVEIVLAEVLNNVVEHAYRDAPGPICICIDHIDPVVEVSVFDQGAPMPGGHLPAGHPTPIEEVEDLPEGGFGWFLIRTLTQDLRYERAGEVNRLCFAVQA